MARALCRALAPHSSKSTYQKKSMTAKLSKSCSCSYSHSSNSCALTIRICSFLVPPLEARKQFDYLARDVAKTRLLEKVKWYLVHYFFPEAGTALEFESHGHNPWDGFAGIDMLTMLTYTNKEQIKPVHIRCVPGQLWVPSLIAMMMTMFAEAISHSYNVEPLVEEARCFLKNRDSDGCKLLDLPVIVPPTDEEVFACIMGRAGTNDLWVPDMLAWHDAHIAAGWTFDDGEDMWGLAKEMFEINEGVLEDIMRRSLVQHLVIYCGGNVWFAGPTAPRVPCLTLDKH